MDSIGLTNLSCHCISVMLECCYNYFFKWFVKNKNIAILVLNYYFCHANLIVCYGGFNLIVRGFSNNPKNQQQYPK